MKEAFWAYHTPKMRRLTCPKCGRKGLCVEVMRKRTVRIMAKFKKPLLFALCLLPIAIVAGIFVGLYQLDIYSDEIIAEVVAQLGSTDLLVVISAVQTVGYALFRGFFGCILADKIGLWKPIKFEKKNLVITLAISLVGGIVFSLDHWTFGNIVDGIQEATKVGLTTNSVIASILYRHGVCREGSNQSRIYGFSSDRRYRSKA